MSGSEVRWSGAKHAWAILLLLLALSPFTAPFQTYDPLASGEVAVLGGPKNPCSPVPTFAATGEPIPAAVAAVTVDAVILAIDRREWSLEPLQTASVCTRHTVLRI